jgi:hypothetical protein
MSKGKIKICLNFSALSILDFFTPVMQRTGKQILANDQLDALFHVFIYFMSLHVSSITMLIIRRSKCINTS